MSNLKNSQFLDVHSGREFENYLSTEGISEEVAICLYSLEMSMASSNNKPT